MSAGPPNRGFADNAPVMQALIYRGSDFEIHTARRSLTRLGSPVDCEPRVFDLIVLLIEQRDRAVDKQELIARLWNGRPVSDASLSQLVYKARKALADDGAARACIQTVHGRGFRWIAEVASIAPAEPASAVVISAVAADLAAAAPSAGAASSSATAHSDAAASSTGPAAAEIPATVASDSAVEERPTDPIGNAVAPLPSSIAIRTDASAPTAAPRAYRRPLSWAFAVLALIAVAGLWYATLRPAVTPAQPRVLVLPVDVAAGLEDLDWARLGMMGLIATALETEAGFATVEPATARRLGSADPASPAQRRAWRETTGARYSLSLRLSRAGPLLQLDAVLDGADGERRRSLFGEEAGRLALDMSGVVRDWLDRRPRGEAPPRDLDGEVAATFALGVDAYLRGNIDSARHYYTLCVERSPDSLQPRLQLATIELKYGDVQRAADLVDEILARVDAQRQPHFAVDAQRVLGYVELQRGRIDAAQAAFERAQLLFQLDSTPAQRAAVFNGLAQTASRNGRFAESAEHLQQSLALYAAVGDAVGEATTWNAIGVLERMRGRTAVAETALLRSLAIARARDVPWQQSLTLANLVQLRVSQRRFREALRLGEAALIQLQPPAPRDTRAERILLQELAVARLQLGQAGVAQRYARHSLALSDSGSDPAGIAMARVVLAQTEVALDQPDALEHYRQAIESCETTGQIPRAAFHLARFAGLQRRAGDVAGLRASVAWAQRLAGLSKTSDLSSYVATAQAQLDAAEGRGVQALQRLLDNRRDALLAEDRTSAQRSGLDYVALAIELGQSDQAGALLAELDAENDVESDALALAEMWRRSRGDEAGAEALRLRRAQLDVALPPPNATTLGTEAGRGGQIVL